MANIRQHIQVTSSAADSPTEQLSAEITLTISTIPVWNESLELIEITHFSELIWKMLTEYL